MIDSKIQSERKSDMYNEEYLNKMEEILREADFAEAAKNVHSMDELQKLFAERGLETGEDMVQAMFDKLVSIRNGEPLSEEDLELVAGGSLRRVAYSLVAAGVVVAAASTKNPKVIGLGVAAAVSVIAYGAKKDLGMK